jgi:hypothetical protein
MTKTEGLKEIEEAKWVEDNFGWRTLTVHDEHGREVMAMLSLRPVYCDRGHIQLQMEGHIELDGHDSFPRFFFNPKEADHHVRCFLKWKLWKERTYEHTFEGL